MARAIPIASTENADRMAVADIVELAHRAHPVTRRDCVLQNRARHCALANNVALMDAVEVVARVQPEPVVTVLVNAQPVVDAYRAALEKCVDRMVVEISAANARQDSCAISHSNALSIHLHAVI